MSILDSLTYGVEIMRKENNVIEINLGFTRVISIKLNEDMVRDIDTIYKKYNYRSRSELIREALLLYTELLKRYNRDEIIKKLQKMINEKES